MAGGAGRQNGRPRAGGRRRAGRILSESPATRLILSATGVRAGQWFALVF
jgi:hypothetical protein